MSKSFLLVEFSYCSFNKIGICTLIMQDNPLVRWNIVNVGIQITFGCNVDWTLDFITKLGWQVKIKSTPEGDESSL